MYVERLNTPRRVLYVYVTDSAVLAVLKHFILLIVPGTKQLLVKITIKITIFLLLVFYTPEVRGFDTR
jgi:hypothetical protein